jgi:hypothetical protein
MQIAPDDLKTLLSVAAFIVSLISLYFTRVNWLQSNRPVVSAFVTEHHSGNVASTFNLVVANTGNRPAVRVRLHASHAELSLLVDRHAKPDRFKMIESNFRPDSVIPLLRNGEELSTSFGAFSSDPNESPWLNYGVETNISISYYDLDGRRYESRQPLRIYARDGFGGGVWCDPKA